jgi:hypothetical protein
VAGGGISAGGGVELRWNGFCIVVHALNAVLKTTATTTDAIRKRTGLVNIRIAFSLPFGRKMACKHRLCVCYLRRCKKVAPNALG